MSTLAKRASVTATSATLSRRAAPWPTLAAPPMPKHDVHHLAVRHALEADGWTVIHDPYTLAVVVGVDNVRIERWRK
jgi:hypothetical protein